LHEADPVGVLFVIQHHCATDAVRERARPDTEVTVLVPKRRYATLWRRVLHDNSSAGLVRAGKSGGEPIVCLTSYHAHTARLLDRHCDLILVGDSLGMVMHGLETTVPVTLDMMILQGRAVMRGSKRALVVVDMPFGSYEASNEEAITILVEAITKAGFPPGDAIAIAALGVDDAGAEDAQRLAPVRR